MLRELHISGLGVIDDLDIELHPGLTVLTGETGAGKTMVTVGLSLAVGARARASDVRQGAAAAKVQARFDAPDEAGDWADDGEVVLARTITVEGKSSARISGQLATASALAGLGRGLLELHGQHGSLRLLEPATQTAICDRLAGEGHTEVLDEHREAFASLRAARQARGRLTEAVRDRERELDLLAYQVREIEAVAPQPGESDRLRADERRLGHVERLLELTDQAGESLHGDGGLGERASEVAAALASAAELDDGVTELAVRARGVAADLVELGRDVRSYHEGLAADPQELEEVRGRLAALRGLQRKYGATDGDVLGFLAEAATRLRELSEADDRLAELDAEIDLLGRRVNGLATRLTEGRADTAPRLASALQAELRELGMPAARVEAVLEPLAEPSATGVERVELRLAAGSGAALPVAKVASGGELSRVMLAARSVLADLDDVPTLVFDEVDAGIGGQAGLAVGRRLAALAATRQVIVVTHLPQIACFADLHVRVAKVDDVATVEPLDDDERVRELSRMLAGLETSDAARTHAVELIDQAAKVRTASARRRTASGVRT